MIVILLLDAAFSLSLSSFFLKNFSKPFGGLSDDYKIDGIKFYSLNWLNLVDTSIILAS